MAKRRKLSLQSHKSELHLSYMFDVVLSVLFSMFCSICVKYWRGRELLLIDHLYYIKKAYQSLKIHSIHTNVCMSRHILFLKGFVSLLNLAYARHTYFWNFFQSSMSYPTIWVICALLVCLLNQIFVSWHKKVWEFEQSAV